MTNFHDKLIKRYVGFDTNRDEYQLQTIHSLLARCNVLTYYLLILSVWLSTIFDVYMQQVSIGTFIILAILVFIGLYNSRQAKKLIDADNTQLIEYYDEKHYKSLLKLIKLQFIHIFILVFTLDFSLSIYGHVFVDDLPLSIHWLDILGALAESFFLTVVGYYIYKIMLEKKY
ncbi:hypothetical protein [Macrococcoides caseolyticum]|uniref:hypothetical protein n=1 Tax=Macrococcoides caseolyticum TaxID=69966 RepID=UPI001F2DC260|nr:hypothetical protein [Macrococcus caseolyticus]MCE4956596.1 hypothetical protein [Macrococcus caseolyticus]